MALFHFGTLHMLKGSMVLWISENMVLCGISKISNGIWIMTLASTWFRALILGACTYCLFDCCLTVSLEASVLGGLLCYAAICWPTPPPKLSYILAESSSWFKWIFVWIFAHILAQFLQAVVCVLLVVFAIMIVWFECCLCAAIEALKLRSCNATWAVFISC